MSYRTNQSKKFPPPLNLYLCVNVWVCACVRVCNAHRRHVACAARQARNAHAQCGKVWRAKGRRNGVCVRRCSVYVVRCVVRRSDQTMITIYRTHPAEAARRSAARNENGRALLRTKQRENAARGVPSEYAGTRAARGWRAARTPKRGSSGNKMWHRQVRQ